MAKLVDHSTDSRNVNSFILKRIRAFLHGRISFGGLFNKFSHIRLTFLDLQNPLAWQMLIIMHYVC